MLLLTFPLFEFCQTNKGSKTIILYFLKKCFFAVVVSICLILLMNNLKQKYIKIGLYSKKPAIANNGVFIAKQYFIDVELKYVKLLCLPDACRWYIDLCISVYLKSSYLCKKDFFYYSCVTTAIKHRQT